MTPAGSVLLDTSIIIGYFRDDAGIAHLLEGARGLHVPITVIGELYYGAVKSSQVSHNLRQATEFLADVNILDLDRETAEIYGRRRPISPLAAS